jgi:hypothetical protein
MEILYLRSILQETTLRTCLTWCRLKGLFGWTFQPAFAFSKAKSQPKGSKAIATLGQKLLLL